MIPLVFGLGVSELLIILAVVLLLFGGTRLAGLGKSAGRALREFKEETSGLGRRRASRSRPTRHRARMCGPGRVPATARRPTSCRNPRTAPAFSSRHVPTRIPLALTDAATPEASA